MVVTFMMPLDVYVCIILYYLTVGFHKTDCVNMELCICVHSVCMSNIKTMNYVMYVVQKGNIVYEKNKVYEYICKNAITNRTKQSLKYID